MISAHTRPLALSEILDRAIELFVRRFGAIVAPLAIVYLPFELVQVGLIGDMHGRTFERADLPPFGVDLLLGVIAYAVARTAGVLAARSAYESRPAAVTTTLRGGLRRCAAQFVLFLAAAACWLVVLIIGAIPAVVLAIALAATGGAPAGVAAIAVVFAFVALPLSLWLYLAYQMATISVATASEASLHALSRALRATAGRAPQRSLLAAIVLALATLVPGLVTSAVADTIPVPALRMFVESGLVAVIAVIEEALCIAFLVIYDADLAVRSEGADLVRALELGEAREGPI